MIADFQEKRVALVAPISIAASGTATSLIVDTYGYEYMRVVLDLGVTDCAVATLKLQHGDAANLSDAADVTGTVYGTDKNDTGATSVLPTATDDGKSFAWQVDLRGRKRYWKVVLVLGTGTSGLVSVQADLSRPHEAPYTAVAAGYAQRMVA
jgi:hypothetical protein